MLCVVLGRSDARVCAAVRVVCNSAVLLERRVVFGIGVRYDLEDSSWVFRKRRSLRLLVVLISRGLLLRSPLRG